jgi:hypothetical protein
MKIIKKDRNSDNLLTVPGIGKSLAEDLHQIGIHHVRDLEGQDPQALYEHLCDEQKQILDPCVLYAFRCAVYYAENDKHDPELLKWWNWKHRTK